MNYDQLTDELSSLYSDIRNKRVEPAVAHELNATVQNITSVVRLGLLNAKLKNQAPDIKFFKEARQKAAKTGARNG